MSDKKVEKGPTSLSHLTVSFHEFEQPYRPISTFSIISTFHLVVLWLCEFLMMLSGKNHENLQTSRHSLAACLAVPFGCPRRLSVIDLIG
jgi:hypothetical protein